MVSLIVYPLPVQLKKTRPASRATVARSRVEPTSSDVPAIVRPDLSDRRPKRGEIRLCLPRSRANRQPDCAEVLNARFWLHRDTPPLSSPRIWLPRRSYQGKVVPAAGRLARGCRQTSAAILRAQPSGRNCRKPRWRPSPRAAHPIQPLSAAASGGFEGTSGRCPRRTWMARKRGFRPFSIAQLTQPII